MGGSALWVILNFAVSNKLRKYFDPIFVKDSGRTSLPCATTIIKLIIFVAYGACWVCVAIIHRTLTWTTGSLSCAQMLMHAITHRGVGTPKESLT